MMTNTKKRGPNSHTRQQRAQSSTIPSDQIQELFDYWKEKMGKRNPVLDKKRSSRIGWGIANYGIEACRQAIDGCAVSDWHMGKNPSNKAYNDISLIFRDAEKVEGFLERYEKSKTSARSEWINSDKEAPF